MSKSSERFSLSSLAASLGWPLLWGAAISAVFYSLLGSRDFASGMWHRYFAGHPVEYVETIMFFVALAALAMKSLEVAAQVVSLSRVTLPANDGAAFEPSDVGGLLDHLTALPARLKNSSLGWRLREALESVERKGTAAELDADLKYLGDLDANRRQDSYSFVRIIVWAIPMLGFLGTVIGITEALGALSPESLVDTPKLAMEGLLGGLAVAFDTTAIALSFSITLMFIQFVVEGVESLVASRVEWIAADELIGRFVVLGSATDPLAASMERMGQELVDATGSLVKHQSTLWHESLAVAERQWQGTLEAGGRVVEEAFTASLNKTLSNYAKELGSIQTTTIESTKQMWENMQRAIVENAQRMQAQQAELVRQGEIMTRVLDATGNVIRLERSLNDNLKTLSGSGNFEQTVTSLAAAVNLLTARLSHSITDTQPVELKKTKSQSKAA